jgi:hypothetical protein
MSDMNMSQFPESIARVIRANPLGAPIRPETDDEMATRIGREEQIIAGWDQAAADSRIAALERFINHGRELGFAYGGTEGDDGISDAQRELEGLRSGPPEVNRNRREVVELTDEQREALFPWSSDFAAPKDGGESTIVTTAGAPAFRRAVVIEATES